ncbi:HipA domain-containing protein [Leucobacter alluvii]|uniref:HipA domain-containing protein n=1 Tax=Leucobacter alluvii TaxID=340321 RepID=UPI0031F747DC
MAKRELNVFLYGQKIGVLSGSASQVQGFKYVKNYSGPKLSLSMPPTLRSAPRITASSWFEGLLPEGHELRSSMASVHDSRDTTTFGLLSIAGLDCAGAVQLVDSEELLLRSGRVNEITDAEIGERLKAAATNQPVSEDAERWSVAGQQGKIALHRTESGVWAKAENGLPTTHILKPGITRVGDDELRDQALIEHVTLDAARRMDLYVARSEFSYFDGVPAIVVERYDRVWDDGECQRIHQEDFCQALGLGPEKKYEENGGPSVADIAALIERTASSAALSELMRYRFMEMVIFNYLSGSPDAHAKNYSMLLLPDGDSLLAPMYDAASGFAFSKRRGGLKFPRAAMKIGHHDRFGMCSEDDWKKFANDVKFDFDLVRRARAVMAERTEMAFRSAITNAPAREESINHLLSSPMLERIGRICRSVSDANTGEAAVIDLAHE